MLAAARLTTGRPGHTLDPTALVHEADPRLASGSTAAGTSSAAAEATRRILVAAPEAPPTDHLLALVRLAADHTGHAELVKPRDFAGLTLQEAAVARGVSPARAKRRWGFARA